MAALGIGMPRRSPAAFLSRDVELARAVCAADETLDALYDANQAEVSGRVLIEPQQARLLTYQIWTSHNLERTGDRAMDVCERVEWLAKGHITEFNVSRY
ncbi:MAG TPA: PhoU domain-containing protein [Dehalococcoidia bacterium]